MGFRRVRLAAAAVVAFVMGFPMATQAMADDASDIASTAVSLASAIIDVAGNS